MYKEDSFSGFTSPGKIKLFPLMVIINVLAPLFFNSSLLPHFSYIILYKMTWTYP